MSFLAGLKSIFGGSAPAVKPVPAPLLPRGKLKPVQNPALVLCSFIELSEAEACLICEIVGGEYITGDSRLTIAQRLASTVDEDWSDRGAFVLEGWETREVDAQALAARLYALTGRQAQAVISAGKRFWIAGEDCFWDEELASEAFIQVGLRAPRP